MKCSLVIPVHNEAEDLERLLFQFFDNLGDARERIIEVHLMENGSTDNTYEVCQKMETVYPNCAVSHRIPIPSYGEAVKHGILSSTGDVVCVLECDAMDVSFLKSSLSLIENAKADFVVASKRHPDAIDGRSFKRRMLSILFNRLLKLFFRFPGSDTHGLKTIRTDVAKTLCEASITGGEVFQTELVLLAHRLGYTVDELPIHLEEKRSTSVPVFKRIPKIITVIRDLRASLSRFPK